MTIKKVDNHNDLYIIHVNDNVSWIKANSLVDAMYRCKKEYKQTIVFKNIPIKQIRKEKLLKLNIK